MRSRWRIGVCSVLAVGGAAWPLWGQARLSELQVIQAEYFQTRVQLATCRATLTDRENRLTSLALTAEETALIHDFRATLRPPDGAVWNWQTRTFDLSEPSQ